MSKEKIILLQRPIWHKAFLLLFRRGNLPLWFRGETISRLSDQQRNQQRGHLQKFENRCLPY
jgi:hypothetical protein